MEPKGAELEQRLITVEVQYRGVIATRKEKRTTVTKAFTGAKALREQEQRQEPQAREELIERVG